METEIPNVKEVEEIQEIQKLQNQIINHLFQNMIQLDMIKIQKNIIENHCIHNISTSTTMKTT